jgi:hypothetical protein
MNKVCNRIGFLQAKEKTCLKSSKIHSHQTKKKEFINREGLAMKKFITQRIAKKEFLTERLAKKELITQKLAKKEFITERAPKKEGIHYREGC